LLERTDSWRALCPTRFALLDTEFFERVRPWPQIVQILLRRTGRRIGDLDALRAITSQPRLEARLVLLLWHLAARWGRVDPTGIRVSLPLTHRMLGQLVGAERPSISHALARLAQAGVVTGTAGDWHLHGTVQEHLESLIERTTPIGEQTRPNGRSRRRKLASGA
jgi:CRP-like cAMP-binding protein